MLKIIVTGGAGFIGSHIVDAYVRLGHKVAIIDNLSTGFKRNLYPKAKFYKADLRNGKLIDTIVKKEKPQIINHHAALASVIASLREPVKIQEVNLFGTINLLLAAGQHGVAKFIMASTGGAMYGMLPRIPADENNPDPISPYALSKLFAEQAVAFYSKNYGFDYTLLRYANVYGTRQNPKGEAGIVAIFSGLMKQGQRPTIFGDGTKTRDYVYIRDIVDANILALSKGKNGLFNLGLGHEISDKQIFDTLAAALNFKQQPIYAAFRPGEVMHVALNASRAKKLLGWRPKTSLSQGIKETIKASAD